MVPSSGRGAGVRTTSGARSLCHNLGKFVGIKFIEALNAEPPSTKDKEDYNF